MTPQERKVFELALEALTHIRPSALTSFYTIGDRDKAITAIKEALAQPEQEPVAWADHGVVNWIADKQFKHASLLYTTPPQRTWVGLTDEEIKQGESKEELGHGFIQGALWAEAALKEKNT